MKKKSMGIAAGVVLFCALAAVMLGVWRANRPETAAGEKHVTVEVVHGDGTRAEFTYHTDLEYLGELLESEGLISGSEGPYGLFVDTVDGETVDFEANGSWWSLACNGEDVTTGADAVVIHDGDLFTWTYTIG